MSELKTPALGWRTAVDPCAECLHVIAREGASLAYPGQQMECYSCHNRLTVVRLVKEGPSIIDRYSFLGDEQQVQHDLVGLLFQRSLIGDADSAAVWMAGFETAGVAPLQDTFKASDNSISKEFLEFTKDDDTVRGGEHVLATIEQGIMGRYVLSSTLV